MTIPALTGALSEPAFRPSASGMPPSSSGGDAAVSRATAQFEAILVRQLLGPALEPIFNGGLAGSSGDSAGSGGGVYGYLLTDTLATALTAGGGLGLAPFIARQLTSTAPSPAPATSSPSA